MRTTSDPAGSVTPASSTQDACGRCSGAVDGQLDASFA